MVGAQGPALTLTDPGGPDYFVPDPSLRELESGSDTRPPTR